ncbi:MAG: hypothetical protein ABW185_27955 [Sedimenticola sp.]
MRLLVMHDETARNEPAHLDLHCLPKPLKQAVGLKGLKSRVKPQAH